MDRLKHKVCIVTGAASGIGLATAERFVEEGAKVLLTDIAAEKGEQAASTLGDATRFARHDVTRTEEWTSVFGQALHHWGRVDVVVNNAGIAPVANIEALTPDLWQRTLDVNLTGVMIGTQQAITHMKSTGGGAIVNVASIEGMIGEEVAAAYNATKGGVRIFSKSAALHCGRSGYNIRVNCVCPGFTETPMVEDAAASMEKDVAGAFLRRYLERSVLGRFGQPREIANGILFLASDEASYMTGADLVIDGGHTA